MKSSVIIARHPLHPMLILVPAGGFILALIGDLAFLGTRSLFWHQFASWSMLIGIIGGLIAAIPGVIDYLTVVPSAARPTATAHMILNLSIVALFAIDLAIRWSRPATSGAALAGVTFLTVVSTLALLFSGWLGGQLVYHFHLGVEEKGEAEPAAFRITLSREEAEEARHHGDGRR